MERLMQDRETPRIEFGQRGQRRQVRLRFGRMAALAFAAASIFAAPFLGAKAGASANSLTADAAPNAAATQSKVLKGLPITELNETEAILHALNRLGYGPRPGEVEHVRQIGLAKWIDEQLNPDSIDDSAMQARLQNFPTLKMSNAKLIEEFPRPAVAAKKEGISVEEYRKQQQEQQRAAQRAMMGGGDQDQSMQGAAGAQSTGANGERAQDPVMQQLQDMSDSSSDDKAAKLGKKGYNGGDPNKSPMYAYQQIHTPARIVAELAMAKMDRAIYSDRQLEEVLGDFWFNHFNVYANKGQDPWFLTSYERDAIRPNVLGKFQDLIMATAKSPAMLFYLDNWQSADPATPQKMAAMHPFRPRPFMMPPNAQGQGNGQQKKREFGINENYGRELMELHTLGVDGGYNQQDVIAVAKSFTGWTIRQPQREAEFFFNPAMHVDGPKTVLGHTINAGGMGDGVEVIKLLAQDPHTARHISWEIAEHFVSDNPPDALVERMTQTFEQKDGDLRAVMRTMIYSPEFWSRAAYESKIKTPFELVASAARAVDANVAIPLPMVMWTARIGEPLYQCQPPTGYKDNAATWVNTGALLNRLNYSLTLASGRMRGSNVDIAGLLGTETRSDPKVALDDAIAKLLNGNASQQTRTTLEKQLDDPQILQASLDDKVRQINVGTVAGLVLGSPEFQRR
jgi:uncharacterized protein (DUF1800 family)